MSIIAANVDDATFPWGEAEPGCGDAVYARACDAKAVAGSLSERILDDFQSFDESCYAPKAPIDVVGRTPSTKPPASSRCDATVVQDPRIGFQCARACR